MALAQGASGIFNAVAFSLASWGFSHIDKKGYTDELRRHNIAMEKMSKDENAWRNARDQENDRLSRLRDERYAAIKSEQSTDSSLDLFRKMKKEYDTQREKIEEKYTKEEPRKNIDQYYKPSKKFQEYVGFTKLAMIAGGIIIVAMVV